MADASETTRVLDDPDDGRPLEVVLAAEVERLHGEVKRLQAEVARWNRKAFAVYELANRQRARDGDELRECING